MKITDPAKAHATLHPVRIKPSHKGLLHRDTGTPMGERIPARKLDAARQSPDPAVRKRAVFADNFGNGRTP